MSKRVEPPQCQDKEYQKLFLFLRNLDFWIVTQKFNLNNTKARKVILSN